MNARTEVFTFEEEQDERLDKFLVRCLPEFSRSRLGGLIDTENVFVNDKPAKKAGQIIERGMKITVRIPATVPSVLVGENIPLDIVFENDDLLVVNKPAGMVVHPAAGHATGTLVHAALGYDPEMEGIGGEERPGVVHRLDKDTSGLIVLAKNDKSLQWLQDQFRLRNVEKVYWALVDGKPPTPNGRVETFIGRDSAHRKKMANVSSAKGREAVSDYSTLESFKKFTLLEFRPHTGRTHQIRLHCKFLGCPIVGDEIYGHKKSSLEMTRHFLHAHRLTITLPNEKSPRTFEAPLPGELLSVLEKLRDQ